MSKGRRRKAKANARKGIFKSKPRPTYAHNQPQRMSFLELPPEIRVQIYSYTIRPESGPFCDFDGLYNSCRLIKQETDYECARVLHKYLTQVERESCLHDNELRFHLPMSFTALRNLRISLSTDAFHVHNKSRLLSETLLKRLESIFALHLDTLVITYHEDRDYPFGKMHIRWLGREILNYAMLSSSMKIQKVVFNLPIMNRECAEHWLRASYSYHLPLSTWSDPHMVLGHEGHSILVYTRTSSADVYKTVREGVWLDGLQERKSWWRWDYFGFIVAIVSFLAEVIRRMAYSLA